MEQELELPVPYSAFVRKKDAEYDGDPNGDYVMAEDVNELQESVERLEKIINIEALENTVSDELNNKVDKAAVSDFGSPLFINYGGSSITTYDTIEKRINAFSYIPHVMLKKEASSSFDLFTKEVKATGTKIYGTINCAGATTNAIESEITWFKDKGFHGVYLQGFGFENGLTRSQQNQILATIHSKNMVAIVTGEIETTLFNKPHAKNPQQQILQTTKDDFYLAQNVFVTDGTKNNPIVIPSLVFNLNKAQQEKGIKVLVEDSADFSNDNNVLYQYGKMLATLYNLDGYSLAPTSRYVLNEKVQKFLQGFELGKWKSTSPTYIEEATSTSRAFAKGTIVFDKVKNECHVEGVGLSPNIFTWQEKQIPGTAVEMSTADYTDGAIENLVESINSKDHKIHYSKIDGLSSDGGTPSLFKDTVVRSINNSPAAVAKNGPGGYDAQAGNDYIHGGVIDWIDAGSIKTGTLNIDHIKTNIIEAINAYIGTAVINNAFIGELSADHIAASVIDAINIYASNISAENAVIDNAVIGELSVEHMKGAVVEAINLYAGEAVIDKAYIGDLDASHIQAVVLEAINASIEEAVIDSAKIGTLTASHIQGMVVEAINLYAGEAKIDAAQIGALKAENISAGLIEALEISAASANFDSLKAAVIDAINASIENAFINGAIIEQGSINDVQIADGSITDAKIVSLVANKIKAGTIDTGQVTLQGTNGHLRITGNRLQVFDDQEVPVERVSIGDVNADGSLFGLRVRGEDGTTVLYDEKGVYSEGITDGAITNPKIAEGAVDGDKHIAANTITADKLVAETITARELAAKSVNANHMQVNAIVAGSGVIGKGAIGEAEIAQASIVDGHIKSLRAEKIEAGSMQITSRNLVSNTTLKKGLLDWTLDPGLDIGEVSQVVRFNTTYSIHLFTTGKVTPQKLSAYSKFTPAIHGETYSASVYTLTKNLFSYDAGQPMIEIEYHSDSVRLSSKTTVATLTEIDVWQRLTVTETAPEGTTRVRIRLCHPQNGDSYFSRAMLQKGSIVTEWTGDGSYMTDDGFYTGDLHADQLTAGKIKAEMLQIGPGTQFETGYSPGELRDEMEDRIPYRVEVISTNGTIFKRGAFSTILKATVYKGTEDLTDLIDASRFEWLRVGADGEADLEWNAAHKGVKEVSVTRDDVYQRATFLCKVLDS